MGGKVNFPAGAAGTYERIGKDGKEFQAISGGRGLNPSEITIAEILKKQGYSTGCFGKWHLGDQKIFLPLQQGFDQYFGIPYSNDMWTGNTGKSKKYLPLAVVKQDKPVACVKDGGDQALLCRVQTEEAVKFIKKNKKKPFFLYFPHSYIHGPRFTQTHLFEKAEGDVTRAQIEEVDWSTGEILKAVKESGIEKNTLVIFTSDNGGSGGTSMGPLRGKKGGIKYEGHMRVPFVAWWPGTIPANKVTHEIGATIDMMPTFAGLAGAKAPIDRIIDGRDISSLLLNKSGAKSPHKILYYGTEAVRRGKWKIVKVKKKIELYDLDADIGEMNDLADKFPDRVMELKTILDKHAEDLEKNARRAAFVKDPIPLLKTFDEVPTLKKYMKREDIKVSTQERKKSGKKKNKKKGRKKK